MKLANDFLELDFDLNFGGAPLHWKNKITGKQLVNPFPGEACNLVFDSGNDGTKASSDGLMSNPIAKLDGSSDYYGRELSVNVSWDQKTGEKSYSNAAYMPYFWMSHEAIDDSIPPDPRGDHGWNTKYHNFLSWPAFKFSEPGVPLTFAPQPNVPSGMILIGDEIKKTYNPTALWNEAYAKIKNGFFAAKFRICLGTAGADAIVGFIFRKEVPTGAGKNINDLYNANGYQLNVNKNGDVEIRKNNTILIWAKGGYATDVNSPDGLKIELRSVKSANGASLDIYIKGAKVDNVGIGGTGDGFGFFASCTTGNIQIKDRAIYDLNILGEEEWVAYDDHFYCRGEVKCKQATPMYRLNLPVIFLDIAIRQCWIMKDKSGTKYSSGESWPPGHTPGTFNMKDVDSIWIGNSNKVDGLFFFAIEGFYFAEVGGAVTFIESAGHIGISIAEIAFNPLPYSANMTPPSITSGGVNFYVHTQPPAGW